LSTPADLQMQQYFHLFMNCREDPHFLADPEGELLAANPAACLMLGREEEELRDCNIANLVTAPEAARRCLRNWARINKPLPEPLTWIGAADQRFPTFSHGSLIEHHSSARQYLLIHITTAVTASAQFIDSSKTLRVLHSAEQKLLTTSRQLQQEISEHRKVKTALEESHARLTTILNSIEAVAYVTDPQTHEVLFINRFGRHLVGEVVGRTCWRSLPADRKGPCSFCAGHQLLTPDGLAGAPLIRDFQDTATGRWYHLIAQAVPWIDGRMVRLGIATDITARKQSDLSLELNEGRLEALWRLNRLEFSSEQEFIRQALDEAVKLTASESGYFHLFKEGRNMVECLCWSSTVQEKCTATKTTHLPLKDGGIWAESARRRQPVIHNDYQREPARGRLPVGHIELKRHLSIPVIDEGDIVAIVGVANKEDPYDQADVRLFSLFTHDIWRILKQKQAEREVFKAKEEWELTFDALNEVVTIHDQEMRIIRANKATGSLLGVDPAALIGRYCYEVFRDATEPCPDCPELLAHADLQPHEAIICHDQLNRTFHVSTSPLINKQGTLQGFIHMAKDVTRQKLLEQKLQHTQKMEAIGVLAGGIAHDFNNILAPIVGYTDLALKRIQPASGVAPHLEQINKAANRARELVQQILTFGRQAPQEKKAIQLHLMVNEVLKLLRSTLPATIEIRQDIPNCGTVLADPIQIHQIVMNLATNSAHAMREKGGVLGIRLLHREIGKDDLPAASLELLPGSYLMLEISDTGDGIPQEFLKRIFEPYFTTKEVGEGSGLGLAVVHGIVESYGGYITVSSKSGRGSTFQVYFPSRPMINQADEHVLHQPLPGGSERILIVDDEEVIVPMLREMLEGLGYSVTIFNNSLDTWELIQKQPFAFDLLVTDMAMPGLTGFDLAKRALAIRPGMPIILCTGFSELMDAEISKTAGIAAFMMKPITMRELAETVRKVLDGESLAGAASSVPLHLDQPPDEF
jgi:PAS domain S-box-containing protein